MNNRSPLVILPGRAPPILAVALALLSVQALAGVTLETDHLRLEIGEDGTLRGLVATQGDAEYASGDGSRAIAAIYRGGHSVSAGEGPHAAVTGRWIYEGGSRSDATRVRQQGDRLMIDFGGADVRATYRVIRTGGYLAFELLELDGGPVDRIEFPRLSVRRLPKLGQWVDLVSDDQFGVCLCAGSLNTDIEMLPEEGRVRMVAAAEATVGFPGAVAVLFGCRDPKDNFLDAMANVERDFLLPPGVAFRRSPLQRLSYLWASRPDPRNIDQYIRWAKLSGFRMIMLSYRAFSKGAGHFEWNDRFPNGMADLRTVTGAIRAAGLRIGLHIHYSKASKVDPYVSPVPDDRLHAIRAFALSDNVTADATTVSVREDPAGCTLDKGRRILKLGKELIEYEGYSSGAPFQFTGCRRGHLGTRAAPQAAGTKLGLLDVDTWPDFIRLDQNTDIQDEVARRLADIYRESGPYDMVYFDGAEDVHEPFWYHAASAQYRVFRLLDPPPTVCEAAHYTHFGWHMMSRANAYDNIAAPEGMKDFCRLMPCPTAAARALDFSRIDFGWLGRFGRTKLGCAGPDVYEYVASRAAGWDCPISLNASLEEFQSNPRAEDCLGSIKTWEDARLGDRITDDARRRLRNVSPEDARYVPCYEQRAIYQNCRENRNLTGSQRRILADRREHHLFVNEEGRHELVEIEEVVGVAEGAVKAFLFHRAAKPEDTWVLCWAVEGEIRLRMSGRAAVVMRPFGKILPCARDGGCFDVSVGPRTYLILADTGAGQARDLLCGARAIR
ncbi:MAG TPA: hypothetical protein PLU30_01065 [Verrucomicrobiae bacterium]|mgnify:CR=1 FL=1|nr:hypothetical protein [Verrucomicrobiae bacterium]